MPLAKRRNLYSTSGTGQPLERDLMMHTTAMEIGPEPKHQSYHIEPGSFANGLTFSPTAETEPLGSQPKYSKSTWGGPCFQGSKYSASQGFHASNTPSRQRVSQDTVTFKGSAEGCSVTEFNEEVEKLYANYVSYSKHVHPES